VIKAIIYLGHIRRENEKKTLATARKAHTHAKKTTYTNRINEK